MIEFEAAYRLYWPLAVVVAGRVLRHPQAAEDAAADAMIKVWRNWGHVTDARSYVVTAARHEAIDQARRARPADSLDALPEPEAPDNPPRAAEHAETLREVAGAFGRVYPSYAAALRLRVAGYGHREIAAILGLTELSAKQAIVKARRQFERAWATAPATPTGEVAR